jgi:hypothetical protein
VRAALIPPKGYERMALRSDIHLVLPLPELIVNPDYLATYLHARARGDYIILDNGCAEGQLVSSQGLVDFAKMIRAHEIVAPDVMDDTSETLKATTTFLNDFTMAADYNIMAVLQGDSWQWLAHEYAQIDAITCIGIPKKQVRMYGDGKRAIIAEWLNSTYPKRFQIHLLGLSKMYPAELSRVTFPRGIRSVDSALPFKAAEANRSLATRNIHHSARRHDYFKACYPVEPGLLKANIEAFKSWAAKHK